MSVKSDYAARAVLGLARHYPKQGALRVEDLAALQGVPANYLVQILIELKAQGIARSVRGNVCKSLWRRLPTELLSNSCSIKRLTRKRCTTSEFGVTEFEF